MLAVRAARPAGFLRDLEGPIHDTPHRKSASLAPRNPVTSPSPAGG
jgi:hypothetical protein